MAKYVTDRFFPNMLWGAVLRSRYPHALIKGIDTSRAEASKGVVAVLTHKDVPGLNAFGIINQDQPVLCKDKVRYLGDSIALVLAESKECAYSALDLIEVDYEPLPVVSDMEDALKTNIKIHEKGNIIEHVRITKGDVEKGFREADLIVEETYYTPRQMHTFLETEGGVATIDQDGNITLFVGSQYPNRDIIQIARSLNYPMEKIRVIAHYLGGGFGGKDEITAQILLALGTLKTGRPVKIVWNREESLIAGQKRLPMKITLKTGVTKDGKLLANKARIIADNGPYTCLGSAIMKLAVEHVSGPYYVPHTDLEGFSVYTNNCIGSAFRGFGATQATFAIECQLDLISKKIGIDPLELRLKNALRDYQSANLGHIPSPSVGIADTLETLKNHDLWKNKGYYLKTDKPYLKRGIGLACSHQGCGLGSFFPDYGAATIILLPGGRFALKIGCPDLGQGNGTAFVMIASEVLCCNPEDIDLEIGDTRSTPDSGSTSASRTTYTGGRAIIQAGNKMKANLFAEASRMLGVSPDSLELRPHCVAVKDSDLKVTYAEIAERLSKENRSLECYARFDWPTADLEFKEALGLPHFIYSYISEMALVEVNVLTGEVRVLKAVVSPDAGRIINRQGLEGQAEGGTVMGMGYALMEEIRQVDGHYMNKDLSTYIIPTAKDAPEIETVPVEKLEASGPFGAKGIGEAVCNPITPAIINAIRNALGINITKIPATPEDIYFMAKNKFDLLRS
ncbi:MAG TPA: molybdopterin-dependent oxidoreductase [Syntrophomonadaceae bacterium]|nr:molybdopterin-dependent oxidoreductase [Syntrophomonadaceae bacterium]